VRGQRLAVGDRATAGSERLKPANGDVLAELAIKFRECSVG
jgi:hypothetical protein